MTKENHILLKDIVTWKCGQMAFCEKESLVW